MEGQPNIELGDIQAVRRLVRNWSHSPIYFFSRLTNCRQSSHTYWPRKASQGLMLHWRRLSKNINRLSKKGGKRCWMNCCRFTELQNWLVFNSSPKVLVKAQEDATKAVDVARAKERNFQNAAGIVMKCDGKGKPAAKKKRVQTAGATTARVDTEDAMMADLDGKESEVDVSQILLQKSLLIAILILCCCSGPEYRGSGRAYPSRRHWWCDGGWCLPEAGLHSLRNNFAPKKSLYSNSDFVLLLRPRVQQRNAKKKTIMTEVNQKR